MTPTNRPLPKTLSTIKPLYCAQCLYIISLQERIYIYGISHIKIYAREITAKDGSGVYFSAPNWNQEFKRRVVTGMDGEDGEDGIDGPRGRS